MRKKSINLMAWICAGLIVSAIFVADRNVGMVIGGIGTMLFFILSVVSGEFRRMF